MPTAVGPITVGALVSAVSGSRKRYCPAARRPERRTADRRYPVRRNRVREIRMRPVSARERGHRRCPIRRSPVRQSLDLHRAAAVKTAPPTRMTRVWGNAARVVRTAPARNRPAQTRDLRTGLHRRTCRYRRRSRHRKTLNFRRAMLSDFWNRTAHLDHPLVRDTYRLSFNTYFKNEIRPEYTARRFTHGMKRPYPITFDL